MVDKGVKKHIVVSAILVSFISAALVLIGGISYLSIEQAQEKEAQKTEEEPEQKKEVQETEEAPEQKEEPREIEEVLEEKA